MASSRAIDPALMDQLVDLTNRQNELRKHVMQLTQQLASGDRERAVTTLTLRELEGLGAETKTYKAIGKAYVLEDQKELKKELEKEKESSAVRDKDRLKLRDQFVDKLKGSEKQSQELAAQISKVLKQ